MSHEKEKRANQFNELKELMELGMYENLKYSNPIVISQADIKKLKPNSEPIKHSIQFNQENVVNTISKGKNAAVLVFCSAKNPGGGVAQGTVAQEEDIALRSSWYFQVKDLEGFYLEKGANAINTDNAIYIEGGYLLKDENGGDIEPSEISFIGATAPNVKGMLSQGFKVDPIQIEKVMSKRIEHVLKIAQKYNKDELILGAWGCGVFGLEAEMVARVFKEKIEENWFTGKITFSIMDKETLEIFKGIIHDNEPKKRVSPKIKA